MLYSHFSRCSQLFFFFFLFQETHLSIFQPARELPLRICRKNVRRGLCNCKKKVPISPQDKTWICFNWWINSGKQLVLFGFEPSLQSGVLSQVGSETGLLRSGAVLGGPNRGQCPCNSESEPPWQGVCINNTMTDFLQWLCFEGKGRNKVSQQFTTQSKLLKL